jgi:hypothetical protein
MKKNWIVIAIILQLLSAASFVIMAFFHLFTTDRLHRPGMDILYYCLSYCKARRG